MQLLEDLPSVNKIKLCTLGMNRTRIEDIECEYNDKESFDKICTMDRLIKKTLSVFNDQGELTIEDKSGHLKEVLPVLERVKGDSKRTESLLILESTLKTSLQELFGFAFQKGLVSKYKGDSLLKYFYSQLSMSEFLNEVKTGNIDIFSILRGWCLRGYLDLDLNDEELGRCSMRDLHKSLKEKGLLAMSYRQFLRTFEKYDIHFRNNLTTR